MVSPVLGYTIVRYRSMMSTFMSCEHEFINELLRRGVHGKSTVGIMLADYKIARAN